MFVQSVLYRSLLPISEVALHSVPVVDYGREALSFECPLQHHTIGQLTTVIEVNRHRCISVGILSILLDPYNNIYD